jgi:acyl-CoA thioester hydrolase
MYGRAILDGMYDVYENTVRYEETDAQGIVFYGNYVTYQDEAFTAYLAEVGYPYEEFEGGEWDVHVVNVELDYRGSAQFRDRLVNAVRVDAINESSIEFEYQCRRKADGEVLVEGTVTHVAVGRDGSPTRVPQEFRDAVVEYQEAPPDPV